jgi:hypothetical protein
MLSPFAAFLATRWCCLSHNDDKGMALWALVSLLV